MILRILIPLLSLLPLKWLYILFGGAYHLIYHVIGYRRVTVRRNLSMSFPDSTSEQIRQLEKAFYRHFADLLAEIVRSFRMSDRELERRVTVENMEMVQELLKNGNSVCGVMGHMGNWEWAIQQLARLSDNKVHALYQPSSSTVFDRYLRRNRERFGARLVGKRELPALVRTLQQSPTALGILADQAPGRPERAHWMTFLRQPTAVHTLTEKLAVRYQMAVVFVDIRKRSRGHYHLRFELVTEQASRHPANWITERHTRMLETAILQQPEIWLWSHRRWKRSHLKPADFK